MLSTSRSFRWAVQPIAVSISLVGLVYDGASWQMIRDWTASSTLAWTPTTADAAYRITVWVKNADSVTTAWDGSASMPFVIQ